VRDRISRSTEGLEWILKQAALKREKRKRGPITSVTGSSSRLAQREERYSSKRRILRSFNGDLHMKSVGKEDLGRKKEMTLRTNTPTSIHHISSGKRTREGLKDRPVSLCREKCERIYRYFIFWLLFFNVPEPKIPQGVGDQEGG